jgi:para-nitrobenzyl esterase
MKKLFYLTGLLFLLNLPVMAENDHCVPVQVNIENGTIEGIQDTSTGLQMYFGIPFAKPPVGNLRWKAPQPADNWDGVLETKKFGPRCVQANVFGDMIWRSDSTSEDCLYLNVWTPARRSKKGLPVLVYFYGGGFVAGDGSEPRYDGASMAKKGMVVLTVNYRLNIFGFFAHPELSDESPYKASGNYGLLDQNAALKWVQKNIAVFGGDPRKVTIAGESAGSISVSTHMASPLSRDLIAGAIGESGAAINPTLFPIPLAEAEKAGLEFAKNAGYPTLRELRALNTSKLFKIYNDSKRFGFPMVVDGYFLPKTLPEIFNAGQQAQIPLLLGWNSAEIPGMAFMQGLSYTEENYHKKLKEAYPDDYLEVLKLYPGGSEKEIERSVTALASDRFIAYSTWKWFDLQRKNSSQPVYRYLYSKLRPPLVDQTLAFGPAGDTAKKEDNVFEMPEPIGAPHACEIEYCLGNLYLVKEYAWSEEDFKVSDIMQNYFANFILTGNPNGDHLPEWPAAEATDLRPPVMIIDVESNTVKANNDQRYLFLDKNYGND